MNSFTHGKPRARAASTYQKLKTCKRWNEPGHAHELTFSCFDGLPSLSHDRTRRWFVKAVDRARSRHAFDVWAYVIMPEHVHLLVRPRLREYDISTWLKAIKWPVAIQSKRYLERNAPEWLSKVTDVSRGGRSYVRFWQRGGGYDRNVANDRALGAMIEYIHANPVRRGLVSEPDQWEWSSAWWYMGQRDVPLLMDDTIA
jgi:putative transposase